MTSPKKKPEVLEKRNYIEIGPNLRAVLQGMIDKTYTCHTDSTYYKIAFAPIYQLMSQLLKEREQEPGDF